MAKTKDKKPVHQLPAGILAADLEWLKWKDKATAEDGSSLDFELWKVPDFGWVIPTLDIAGARNGFERRTYGIRLDNNEIVRVGRGPHVEVTVQVYVTKKRLKDLQKFIDVKKVGMVAAQTARDRISTRRAQTAMRRSRYLW